MTTPITKANYQIKNVDDIPKIVHEAFYIANTGRKGPVVIDFPKDMGVLKTSVPVTNDLALPGYHVPNEPNVDDIKALVSLLTHAKNR